MTWNAFHNRGEILRQAIDVADERRDGLLPMSVPGATEVFDDELDLLGAMMLKWHTRLAGNVDRALSEQPLDLADAVAAAWVATAQQLPGVRMIMDRYATDLDHPDAATALGRAREREWARLAILAGLASTPSPEAAGVGRRIEERARRDLTVGDSAPATQTTERASVSFVDRIKAVLAA